MYYYEVIPATNNFHGKEPLTYSFDSKLADGQVVSVRLRNKPCSGIVMRNVKKPAFKTVDIEKILPRVILPGPSLKLLLWLFEFYPGNLGASAQMFAPGLLDKATQDFTTETDTAPDFSGLPKLTDEQLAAYQRISKQKAGSYIIHGVTGSGKTRLYMELARQNITSGKSVIILTPEISLTAPIAKQFQEVYGNRVKINHSSLTPKQKLILWQQVLFDKRPIILIGPRSTLFLPLNNLGLIVVDEFHEPAYKQESSPFYHANRVASKLAQLSGASVVFGSATPPIHDYFLALKKDIPVLRLDYPAITGKKVANKHLVVDLLDKDEASGYPLLSKSLINLIKQALAKNEQVMLFINKRGSARSISCQDCGHKEVCSRCDLPLVYHADEHIIRCHTCGFKKAPPSKCPKCSSIKIYFASPGTKAIVESLNKLFSGARIARFDKDNKKADRLENNYEDVLSKVDIIVGTQIVAKGHDLPRLSLVAMLLAENGLDFPDFSSEERSYQLIKQLSGRVNRGHRDGLFVIQTFNKSGRLLQSAVNGSWGDFFTSEIEQRKKHGFPPYFSALKIETARASRKSAIESLEKLMDKLSQKSSKIEFLGPSPSFIEKKSSKWHWQLIVKSRDRSVLTQLAQDIPSSFRSDIDPANFL